MEWPPVSHRRKRRNQKKPPRRPPRPRSDRRGEEGRLKGRVVEQRAEPEPAGKSPPLTDLGQAPAPEADAASPPDDSPRNEQAMQESPARHVRSRRNTSQRPSEHQDSVPLLVETSEASDAPQHQGKRTADGSADQKGRQSAASLRRIARLAASCFVVVVMVMTAIGTVVALWDLGTRKVRAGGLDSSFYLTAPSASSWKGSQLWAPQLYFSAEGDSFSVLVSIGVESINPLTSNDAFELITPASAHDFRSRLPDELNGRLSTARPISRT